MLPYVISLFVLIALPAWFIYSLWRANDTDRMLWLMKACYMGAFLAYLFEVGRWDFVSVHLRVVLTVVFFAALAISYWKLRSRPWVDVSRAPARGWSYAVPFALVLFFGAGLAWTLSARHYEGPAVPMSFPLQHGQFYVGQGGNRAVMNYHNSTRAQRYALDIHELNGLGMRAAGLYPDDLTRYVIFGQPVVSPCSGRIESAVDAFPDLPPGQHDRDNVAGNHVAIACKGVLVLLAHLQSGSLHVQAGDVVAEGAPIGAVGNSGNTSEPHLHFHAVHAGSGDGDALSGESAPVTFRGIFPVRNTVL